MGWLDGQLSLGIQHVFTVHLDILGPEDRAEASQWSAQVEHLKKWLEFGMNGWDEKESLKYRENVRFKKARGDYEKRMLGELESRTSASTRITLQADGFLAQEGAALSRRLAGRALAGEVAGAEGRGLSRRAFGRGARAAGAEVRGVATAGRLAKGLRMARFIRGIGRIAKFARFL